MARSKPPTSAASSTRQLFSGSRKSGESASSLTSERIADDLARFRKSGGRIEVLGTTRTLTRIDTPVPETAPPPRKRRGGG